MDPDNPDQDFPPAAQALKEPEGLLAVGGCLTSKRIVNAYKHGIFPWFLPGEPILWWSPDPRLVLFPDRLKISRSLKKTINRKEYSVSFDTVYADVISACASCPRKDAEGTWITAEINQAYNELFNQGIAHSIETWKDGELVGGLYGLALGKVFYGESMFHHQTDASKVAFVKLVELLKEWDYQLIDCQVHTVHLISLGAEQIARQEFLDILVRFCNEPPKISAWKR